MINKEISIMSSDIRKSNDSEEGPQNKLGGSDKTRKGESDRKKENQGDTSRKKPLSGLEQLRRLQQHNAELKAHSSQDKMEEVKENIEPNERQESIVPRMAYNRKDPLLLDLMHELQYKRQEIPKPPASDTHKDKG
jgi:anti-sigma28 factor (negative regulator of flagellin synthesis)